MNEQDYAVEVIHDLQAKLDAAQARVAELERLLSDATDGHMWRTIKAERDDAQERALIRQQKIDALATQLAAAVELLRQIEENATRARDGWIVAQCRTFLIGLALARVREAEEKA